MIDAERDAGSPFGRIGALALLLVVVSGAPSAAAAATTAPGQELEEIARSPLYRWLERHQQAAYWAAPLLMVVVAILPIPAEIPAAMNGMLFGAGLTGRLLKPEALAKIETLRTAEAAVLIALRLTPVVAFTLVNWACGLLGVRRTTFLWTTAIGILPGAIAFTISGSAMAVAYQRYPGTVSTVAVLFLVLIALRVWWKQRTRGAKDSSSTAP